MTTTDRVGPVDGTASLLGPTRTRTGVRLTKVQARQLGLPGVERTTPKRKGRDRSTVPDKECARNVCHACGEVMAGETAEARHVKATGHHRYESTLTLVTS